MLQQSDVFATLTFIFIFAFITNGCNYNEKDQRAHCSSFKDLETAGPHLEWSKLNVIKSGNESMVPIKKDSFINAAHIVDLQVKGLANEIEPGAFNGLEKLYELHLDDNTIKVIPAEAFAQLPFQVLYVFYCEVNEIRPGAFNNAPNVKHVNFYGNHISTIEEGVFTNTKIEGLIMRRNRIRAVKPNAFGGMEKLFRLSLEENEMTSFEPQFAVGFNPTINYLYINRNKLTKITRDMFSIMPNLKIILLNLNAIQRFGDYVFNDLKQLTLLDISNNRLEEIQSNIFNGAGMRYLQVLFVHDNRLSFISTGVLARLPSLKRISVGGNPWQCPCWNLIENYLKNHNITHLCYEIYTQGQRPFCVLSDVHKRDCILDIESVKDIPQIYDDIIREYPNLPPVCNIDGADTPFLGA